MTGRIRELTPGWWALCLPGGVLLRALSVPELLGDLDSVNLARGLERFDVFAQAPHFPGYPLLIAAAKLARALGAADPVWALALPGIASFPVAGALLFVGLRHRLGPWPAFGALAVASLSPGAVISCGWSGSEGLGFSLLIAATGLLALDRRASVLAGWLALGLLLGVRLSWWPIVLALGLLSLPGWRARLAPASIGGALGTLVWLVPMVWLFGAGPLLELAVGFGEGHVTAWGGTALQSQAAAALSTRVLQVVWGVWDAGLGASWPGLAPGSTHAAERSPAASWLAALGAFAALLALRSARSCRPRRFVWLVVLVAPYLVWLLGFQNVAKPRHLIPLLPVLGALVGVGLSRLPQRGPVLASWIVAMSTVAWPRAYAQGTAPAPGAALLHFMRSAHAPSQLLIFAGEEARVLEHYAPMYRVLRPARGEVLEVEAERAASLGVEVWITSSAPGFERVRDRLIPLQEFRFRHSVRPHESRLLLTRYQSAAPGTALARAEGAPCER